MATGSNTAESSKSGAAGTTAKKEAVTDEKSSPATNAATAGAGTSGGDLNDPKTSYENAKKELIQALHRKKQLDKQLVNVETQIFTAESQYIADTAGAGGNIIHGFENYLKSASTNRKRVDVSEADRVFSLSSNTFRKNLELADEDSSLEDFAHVNPVTGITTVLLTPATRQQEAQNKRERDKIYQRKKRASMRQSTISDEEMPTKKKRKFED